MMAIPEEISTLVFDWGDTLMLLDARFSGVIKDDQIGAHCRLLPFVLIVVGA